MARRANRTIWLIPEPDYLWGSGDSDMLEYFPLCSDVLQVNSLCPERCRRAAGKQAALHCPEKR
jgi:hypothetical protein